MPVTELRKIIRDTDGVEHKYVSTTFDAWTGLPLFRKVQRVLASTVGNALEGVGSVPASLPTSDDVDQNAPDPSLMRVEIKGAPIERALVPVVDLVTDKDFILKLFSTTSRDGVALDSQGSIGMAYQANYGELCEAMAWLIKENFIDPLLSTLAKSLGSSKLDLIERMRGFFPELAKE